MLTRRQLSSGLYRRLLRNVYVDRGLPDDHQMRARAAALLMPRGAAVGGRSAAAWFGAPFSSVTDPVLVVVPPGCSWDGPRGVQVHKTHLGPADARTTEDGVRLTSAPRTAWELATLETAGTAVAHIDGMLRDGALSEQALTAEIGRRRGQWGSKRAAAVLPLVDGRAQSPPESRVRVACALAGLPAPVPQFRIEEDGRFLAEADLAWPERRLVVEYQGAYHFDELQIVKDDARCARLVAARWRVIRLSAADLRSLEDVVTRIAAALAESSVRG